MNQMKDLLGEIAAESKYYDVTETAIRSGRRRQLATRLAPVAVLVVAALVAVGVWLPLQYRPAPLVDPAEPPTSSVAHVAVFQGKTLWTANGTAVTLPVVAESVYAMPRGWYLVESQMDSSGETLWSVNSTGTTYKLAEHATEVVVDTATGRIAWGQMTSFGGSAAISGDDATLATATLSGNGQLADLYTTHWSSSDPDSRNIYVEALFGDDGVVLAGGPSGDSVAWYDTWRASRGDYRPTKSDAIALDMSVYRGTDDGRILGLSKRGDTWCLAFFAPDQNLNTEATDVCFAGPNSGTTVSFALSDGLVLVSAKGHTDEYRLADGSLRYQGRWKIGEIGAAYLASANSALFVITDSKGHDRVVSVDTTRPGTTTPVTLPHGVSVENIVQQ